MSKPCTVIIGALELLDALRESAGEDREVLTFSDNEPLKALEAITTRQPTVIALERLFAATSRGAALINRIKADPTLADVEIRVVSVDGTYRVSARRTPAPPVPSAAPAPVALPAPSAPPVQVDDVAMETIEVVDLSTFGAQILCPIPLKPQQKVRMVLADDLGLVKFSASVAWAFFEIPKGVSQYRAGVEFKDAEPKAVDAFGKRHKS